MLRHGFRVASEAGRAQAALRTLPGLTRWKATDAGNTEFPTEFLGTPKNHAELQASRPMSPNLFDVDMSKPHYKFPPIALSSVTNRVTGVMLSVGMGGVGYVSLTGDVVSSIEALKSVPLVLPIIKFSMAFPLTYHTLGGFRHLW